MSNGKKCGPARNKRRINVDVEEFFFKEDIGSDLKPHESFKEIATFLKDYFHKKMPGGRFFLQTYWEKNKR